MNNMTPPAVEGDKTSTRRRPGAQTEAEVAAVVKGLQPAAPTHWCEASEEMKRGWAFGFAESKLGSPMDASGGYDFLSQVAQWLVAHTDRYALALVGGKHRVINLEAEKFETMPLDAYKAMTMNVRFPVYDKDGVKTRSELTLGDLWCVFPKRQNFTEGVTFAPPTEGRTPYVNPVTTHNIFAGFRFGTGGGAAGYPLFREHLFDVVCQRDEERFNFVMAWFADVLRNPGRKTGSAMIFRGEEGVGKSLVGEQFAKLIGDRYAVVASTERQVLGNFNSHLSHALFCQVEEALFAGSKGFGTLKQLVTGERMAVELKGVDVLMVPNFTRFLMCSNEDWVVPAGADARRWFVTDVCSDHKGDGAYFQAVIDEMDHGGREAWAKELLAWPIDEALLRNPPDTEELGRQRLRSFNAPEQFFVDLLKEGSADLFPRDDEDKALLFPVASEFRDALYGRYEDYVLRRSGRYDANRSKFQDAMDKVLGLRAKQMKVRGANQRRYSVPPLDKLREEVAERLKVDPADLC